MEGRKEDEKEKWASNCSRFKKLNKGKWHGGDKSGGKD
jgi:hypothetical protein